MKLMTKPTLWDWKYIVFIVVIISFIQPLSAQQKLPTVKATSRIADVKDGEVYQKDIWNLSPENKPDIYFVLEPVQISAIKPVKKAEPDTVLLNNIEPELLRQDFVFFREQLEKEHAGLYRYKSKVVLDKLFDSCFAALNHQMSQLEFAKSITFIISSIQDGHTGTNLSRLLMNYYTEKMKMFPAYVYFINTKAYVLCSRINELPAVTEILSIDNTPISEIKKKLLQYLPSDGKIQTKKNQVLNNGAFSFLYNWIFGNKNSFTVRYKTKQGEIKTTNINAEFVKDFECDNGSELSNKKDLQLDFPEKNTALLTIKTFDNNRLTGKQDFRNFLTTTFNEINSRKISELIIDLRENAGGADVNGALLYSYLANKPFKYFYSIESTTNKITVEVDSLLGIQQPQNNSFNGKVLFLINGLCFSTTADFCSIAKSNNRGKFIGEETGGGYYGNTSGQTTKVELPNSKINITIPKFKYVNAVKKSKHEDRGIIPDYTILPTIYEVILHKDVQLDFALKLAREK